MVESCPAPRLGGAEGHHFKLSALFRVHHAHHHCDVLHACGGLRLVVGWYLRHLPGWCALCAFTVGFGMLLVIFGCPRWCGFSCLFPLSAPHLSPVACQDLSCCQLNVAVTCSRLLFCVDQHWGQCTLHTLWPPTLSLFTTLCVAISIRFNLTSLVECWVH